MPDDIVFDYAAEVVAETPEVTSGNPRAISLDGPNITARPGGESIVVF